VSNKVERIKKMKIKTVDSSLSHRVPPGQIVTERFPILHEGEVPVYNMDDWTLHVLGEVEEERTFTFSDLMEMPQSQVTCDIHCVTRWSKLDTTWEGVLFQDFLTHCKVKPTAKYVMIHGDYDYTANVPLEELLKKDILLAHKYDGENLAEKHGWPLRLIVPHLYFWKSVKWIRGIEFMSVDEHGFWERNGFHNEADPFKEERFSGENLPIAEDEWERKEYD
jgi:DMSO/TMAO reductase YedYZ molybdopterin-dependent catalytic subunit